MQLANSPTRYGTIPQAFHWIAAICVVAAWLLGQFMFVFARASPERAYAVFTHMMLGQIVLTLLVLRLVWRFANPPPPMERTRFDRLLRVAAKASHYTLYLLLVVTPLAGIAFQLKRAGTLPVFGIFELHSSVDRGLAQRIIKAHYFLANALMILASVHAAAALIHHYVFRDRTLVRMLPGDA